MQTQKQNALCACGSAKKYKHCCGHKSLTNKDNEQTNTHLSEFHHQLVKVSTDDFKSELDQAIEEVAPDWLSSSSYSIYQTGLLFWFAMYYVLPHHNLPLVDLLMRFQSKDYSFEAVRYLTQWKRLIPSVYHVEKVTEEAITLKEVPSGVDVTIDRLPASDFEKDTMIVGVLAPYADTRQFLMAMVTLHQTDEQMVKEAFVNYPYQTNMSHFPAFFAHLLENEKLDIEWANEQEEQVADLFIEQMMDQDFSDDVISEGVTYWNTYCKENKPQFKNGAAYAAAIEYNLRQKSDALVTQAEIADRYRVNPSTLSQIIKRLT